jgi:hypothetical protein
MVVLNPTTAESIVEAQGPARTGAVVTACCRERGCEVPGFIACAYVDGRGRSCETRWCSHHAHKVGAKSYCRRHASTVAALGGKVNDPRALPVVDHRGASLVNWVCTEGHDALREAVAAELRPGEVIFDDHTVNVVRRPNGSRRWEQGWRIGDRGGLTGRVLICVDECDDALISVEVGTSVVACAVPPWITRRRAHQEVGAVLDASDRARFYGFLISQIRHALAARR